MCGCVKFDKLNLNAEARTSAQLPAELKGTTRVHFYTDAVPAHYLKPHTQLAQSSMALLMLAPLLSPDLFISGAAALLAGGGCSLRPLPPPPELATASSAAGFCLPLAPAAGFLPPLGLSAPPPAALHVADARWPPPPPPPPPLPPLTEAAFCGLAAGLATGRTPISSSSSAAMGTRAAVRGACPSRPFAVSCDSPSDPDPDSPLEPPSRPSSSSSLPCPSS